MLEIQKKITPNENFMSKCEICGGGELIPSTVCLMAHYGSEHDGEKLILNICGACADKLFLAIREMQNGRHSFSQKQEKSEK